MNLYKRINTYTLEHYPIAWNTHIIWMTLSAILINAIFWVMGYMATNMHLIKSSNFSYLFTNAAFSLLYGVSILVIGILWLIKVYKNNPMKSFYKLDKLYLFKVFLHFFIIIFLHSLVYFSFTKGKYAKTKTLLHKNELVAEIHTLNNAYPFFLTNLDDYKFEARAYPNPFPLKNLIGKTSTANNNEQSLPNGLDNTKPYIKLGDRYYQFGTTTCKTTSNCIEICSVDSVYDISKVYGLATYSLYNFSTLLIQPKSFLPSNNYAKNNAPYVHSIINTRNAKAITATIDSVKQIAVKYNVEMRINTNELVTAALKPLDSSITDIASEENSDAGYDKNITTNKEGGYIGVRLSAYQYEKELSRNHLNKSDLENVYENYEKAYDGINYKEVIWFMFFFSLAAAYLLLMGKFATGINILLSAVIAGGLSIAFGLLMALILSNHSGRSEESFKLIGTLYAGIVLLIGIIAITTNGISKWLVDKLALITYVTIPVFLCFLWSNFYPKGGYIETKDPCYGEIYKSPAYTPEPWHFVIVCAIAIIPAFILIRKWISRPA